MASTPSPARPARPPPEQAPGQALPERAREHAWEYAPAPESRDIATIAPSYGLFIGGEFGPAADGAQFSTLNPATEEPLAQVALDRPLTWLPWPADGPGRARPRWAAAAWASRW